MCLFKQIKNHARGGRVKALSMANSFLACAEFSLAFYSRALFKYLFFCVVDDNLKGDWHRCKPTEKMCVLWVRARKKKAIAHWSPCPCVCAESLTNSERSEYEITSWNAKLEFLLAHLLRFISRSWNRFPSAFFFPLCWHFDKNFALCHRLFVFRLTVLSKQTNKRP